MGWNDLSIPKLQRCNRCSLGIDIKWFHYIGAIMSTMAYQITSLTIIYATVYLSADQRKHQSSASLAFVWGINRWPVNSPHKGPVMRKTFPFDDVIMFIPHFTGACDYISMQGLKLNHVSKRGPRYIRRWWLEYIIILAYCVAEKKMQCRADLKYRITAEEYHK